MILTILLLMFLFWGEPDLFDALRDFAIRTLKEAP
jgi:hypothetical protein